MKIAEGKLIGRTKSGSMVEPRGRHKKVISKAARHRTQGPHTISPWVKEVSHDHHAKGASWGNATGVVMGITEATSYGVVIFAAGMKRSVCKKGARREPTYAT